MQHNGMKKSADSNLLTASLYKVCILFIYCTVLMWMFQNRHKWQ